jgi:hypothetical protein
MPEVLKEKQDGDSFDLFYTDEYNRLAKRINRPIKGVKGVYVYESEANIIVSGAPMSASLSGSGFGTGGGGSTNYSCVARWA